MNVFGIGQTDKKLSTNSVKVTTRPVEEVHKKYKHVGESSTTGDEQETKRKEQRFQEEALESGQSHTKKETTKETKNDSLKDPKKKPGRRKKTRPLLDERIPIHVNPDMKEHLYNFFNDSAKMRKALLQMSDYKGGIE
ncbi:hypothetical protein [Fusibacter sp. JL216-2]|uniref:hypothetical protein n=1 Tax=Fusibacter sp. JL216-2 TaxID=3071453 RepID=UPI003D3496B9